MQKMRFIWTEISTKSASDWAIGDDYLYGWKVKVCKNAFAVHYGLSESTLDNIISDLKHGILHQSKKGHGEDKDAKEIKNMMEEDALLLGIPLNDKLLAYIQMSVNSTMVAAYAWLRNFIKLVGKIPNSLFKPFLTPSYRNPNNPSK